MSAVRVVLVAVASAAGVAGAGSLEGDVRAVDFARDVRPILSRNCLPCHGPDPETREAELRLDVREAALSDRDGRAAIVPGNSSESELLRRVADAFDPMPPHDSGRTLEEHEVDLLRRWIDAGAEYTPHWAFAAPKRPRLPEVSEEAWPRNEIDRFVLARLEREGLSPSPEADRYTLIRRLSLDLTGLPPTLEEVHAFVADEREDAYDRLVDRLLASSAYGERMARVWLDLARYADSKGHGSDPLRTIWRYRDWVIDAFDQNLPYDRFTVEQLAGDLLPEPTVDQRLATAFHRNTMNNTEGGTDDEEFRVAAVKDRAITTAQVWMGLTLGCAQCHAHKFDPISHEDFYRFYAFFDQTADADTDDDAPLLETPTAAQAEALAVLRGRAAALEGELAAASSDVSDGLRVWEAAQRRVDEDWEVLRPVELRSDDGTELVLLEDGSILATGPSPEADVYTVRAVTTLDEVTAVRLDVLTDESLPRGGPGRSPGNGNVVLDGFELHAAALAPAEVRGRYVRITGTHPHGILSLAEVEVYSGGENVAPSGVARQSSTEWDAPARLAVDGVTDGAFASGSVTHTAAERAPWWELDLGDTRSLQRIRVWNRTDHDLEERLAGSTVTVLGEAREVVWATALRTAPDPDVTLDPTRPGEVLLANASADFSQEDWAVEFALDGTERGWGLNPELGRSHQAVFETAGGATGHMLTFTLRQGFGGHHTLGRFRLSATDRPRPVRALPGDVAEALATPDAERDQSQRAALLAHYQTVDPALAEIRGRIDAVRQEELALGVVKTPVLVELPPDERRTTYVMRGGNFLERGARVEPGVPASLHAWPNGEPRNRLGLARWITSSDNPLTARVAVNRWWAMLFGAGLVETEEDFGTQGSVPTHPELLDWLAVEYVENGWDTKALLRTIVGSATYRQASDVQPEHLLHDPENRLHARGARFRLEAEAVRDAALATGGLLSRTLYGPSVYPPQPEGMWQAAFNGQREWQTSEGEDRYRRGIYVFLRRTIPYPSLATFDAPSRESCTPRRFRTNTPLQAFVTLNDPAFVEAAQALARRIVTEGGQSVRERVEHGLWLCLQRPPRAEQIEVLAELFECELEHFRTDADAEAALALATDPLGPLPDGTDAAELAAWTVVANVLLNLDAALVRS